MCVLGDVMPEEAICRYRAGQARHIEAKFAQWANYAFHINSYVGWSDKSKSWLYISDNDFLFDVTGGGRCFNLAGGEKKYKRPRGERNVIAELHEAIRKTNNVSDSYSTELKTDRLYMEGR